MRKADVGSRMYLFSMSATVSEAAQNISGELTHTMGSTSSMQRRIVVSEERGGDHVGEGFNVSGPWWAAVRDCCRL